MKYLFFVLSVGTLLSSYARDQHDQKYKVYILQPGDTLSELLARENYTPLYGPGNWVDRIVQANHLTKKNVNKIKRGLPIILPTDKDINQPFNAEVLTKYVEDEVSTKKSAIIQTGLFGNSISKHQNYAVNFGYFYRSINADSFNIRSGENFLLSLAYKDKKNNVVFGFNANPSIEFGVITHGSNYTDNDSLLNFQPTLFINSSFMLKKSDQLEIGPSLKFERSSKAENDENDTTVRRDNLVWVGVSALQSYENAKTTYQFKAEFNNIIASHNINSFKEIRGFQFGTSMNVNLHNNYYVGFFINRELFENTATNEITQSGINLKYILE